MARFWVKQEVEKYKPIGVRGWLLLLIFRLCLGGLIFLAYGVLVALAALGMTHTTGMAVGGRFGLALAYLVPGYLAVEAAALLWKKKRAGVWLAGCLLFGDAAYCAWWLYHDIGLAPDDNPLDYHFWLRPACYFMTAVCWLAYLVWSDRVANTYPTRHRQFLMEEHRRKQESLVERDHAPAEEFDTLKARVKARVGEWLNALLTNPPDKHRDYIEFLRHVTQDTGMIARAHLGRIDKVCDEVFKVQKGEMPTILDTPDSKGSLHIELQKWAVHAATIKLTRALDIQGALNANPQAGSDTAYLLEIVCKIATRDDGFGGSVELADYQYQTSQEILPLLRRQAEKDSLEADLWARVAFFAGYRAYLGRLEEQRARITEEVSRYWVTSRSLSHI